MYSGVCLSVLPSSSAEMAKRGMMSRLWVLFITSGLALRSDWEELDEARGRRLGRKRQQTCRISITTSRDQQRPVVTWLHSF